MECVLTGEVTAAQLIAYYFDLLNLIFVSLVAVYMTFFCLNTENEALLNWHVWLCTIGVSKPCVPSNSPTFFGRIRCNSRYPIPLQYQVLMAEGILSFYQMNSLTLSCTRKRRKTIHWVLQSIGVAVTFIGILLEFLRREKYGSAHFTSVHSVTGLIAGIFSVIALINGIAASKAYDLRSLIKPIYSKCLHNAVGLTAFVIGERTAFRPSKISSAKNFEIARIGMVSLYYGYDAANMVSYSRKDIRVCLQVLAVITILLSLIGALQALVRQIRTIVRIHIDE